MTLVSQKLDNLLGGVSQRDERRRAASQAEIQENGYSDPATGLRTRPPSEFVAELDTDQAAYDDAWSTIFDRDLQNRFRIIIRDGDIKAFDYADGTELTVNFPDGKGYLVGSSDYRAVRVEDALFIVNREAVITRDPDSKSEPYVHEALVWVRSGAEDTRYSITLDNYTGSTTTAAAASDFEVDTRDIADDLETALEALTGFTDDFVASVTGSSVYIRKTGGGAFSLSTADGLSDQGLVPIYKSVESFQDLPPTAPAGFQVEIVGSPETDFDNYWVEYDITQNTWIETAAPEVLTEFGAGTMPHRMVLKGALDTKYVIRGAPTDPSITSATGTPDAVSFDNENGTAIGDGVYGLQTDGEYFEYNIDATYQGTSTSYRAEFQVETTDLGSVTMNVYLKVYDSGDVLQETLDSESYTSSDGQPTDTLEGSYNASAGDYIRLEMEFVGGSPPASEGYLFINNPALEISTVGQRIDFGSTEEFPEGFQVTVTVSGTAFNYTPSGDDTDGEELATEFQTLIDAHADWAATVSAPGVLDITDDGGGTPSASVTFEFDTSTDLWLDVDISGVDYSGTTVTNLTDGSTATVSSSTTTGMKTGGLSGGSDNTFTQSDLVEIAETAPYFSFEEADWAARETGDATTNPFPPFLRRRISDLVFYQGRLGFIYDDRIYFSRVNKPLNLFRRTATQLLDDDSFEAQSALTAAGTFDAGVEWNESLYIKADGGVVLVSGDPILTPTTIRMDLVSEVKSNSQVLPAVVGQSLFLPRKKENGATQIQELLQEDIDVITNRDITQNVPSYLDGDPVQVVGSGALGFLAVLCTGSSSTLYIYKYLDRGRDRLQSSWSKWTFPDSGEILTIDLVGGVLGMVVKYPDAVYLETLNLDRTVV